MKGSVPSTWFKLKLYLGFLEARQFDTVNHGGRTEGPKNLSFRSTAVGHDEAIFIAALAVIMLHSIVMSQFVSGNKDGVKTT